MATQPWWEDAPLASPANNPTFSGFVQGPPKKPEIRQVGKQLGIVDPVTGAFTPTYTAPGEDDAPPNKALQDAISGLGLSELLSGVRRARKQVQTGWATGTWGALAELKPGGGTPRDDFKASLQQVQGGIILEKLQSLKEASKTGASGMGALSEKEGERLASAVSALNDKMSPAELERSFRDIERHALTLEAVRAGHDPNDPAVQKDIERNLGAMPDATLPAGDGSETQGQQLTPDQEKKLRAFVEPKRGNLTPEQFDGIVFELTGKHAGNADEWVAAFNGGARGNTTLEDMDPGIRAEKLRKQQDELGLGESPVTTLTKSGATLNLSDEAAGVGNAAANLITSPFSGNLDPFGAYRVGRDAERLRIEDARKQLGYGGTALEIGGGFLSANPTTALAPFLGTRQLISQGAKAGAYGGALAGFGTGEGLEDSATKSLLGAGAGAALGGGISAASSRYAPRGRAPELARASEAEGVDLLRPMVDPNTISDYGALESNIYSQPIIRGAAARVRGQVEDRVEALGRGGTPLEEGAAGEKLQLASNRYITRTRGIKDRLYGRAEKLAGDTRFAPDKAVAQVDAEIAQLSGNEGTNAAEIGFLQTVKDDLAKPGGKTVAEIRNIREGLRGEIGRQNLTFSGAEARALRVMDAAANDIADKVPSAASAYRRADNFYRERMVMVDDIKRAILGKKDDPLDPQKAFANIKSLASPGANGRRLAAVMRNLEPDERQDIAATVAQSLGRRSADEPFSTALFLSQTRKLSPSARKTIFGPDGAQSIDNLRLLSRKLEEAEKDINRSRSATVLERQGWRQAARTLIAGIAGLGGQAATGSLAGGVAGVGVATAAMGASAARRVLSARAMVNPRVSRWLAQVADVTTPAQAQQALRKLGIVISREPALAGELQPIHDMLTRNVGQRIAASDPNADNRREGDNE